MRSERPDPRPCRPGRPTANPVRRLAGRGWLLAAGIIAGAAVIVGCTQSPEGSPPSDAAAPAASRSGATVRATPIPEMSPGKPGSRVTQENDIVVELAKTESVTGEARLPGELAGPAIRVTITVKNNGSAPLALANTRVSAYYGAARTPAGMLTAPGGSPFDGALTVGNTATGVYLFGIPTAERGNVTVTVDTAAGTPMAVFTGKMG